MKILRCSNLIITLIAVTFKCQHVSSATTLVSPHIFDAYPQQPNEILPIKPILIYPQGRTMKHKHHNFAKQTEIIYIKLLKHPLHRSNQNKYRFDTIKSEKDLKMNNIFYVKALANGQFSHQRLKVYRLPEFYTISVYHKGDQTAAPSTSKIS